MRPSSLHLPRPALPHSTRDYTARPVRKNSESEWELPKLNGLVVKRNDICGHITSWLVLIFDMKAFIQNDFTMTNPLNFPAIFLAPIGTRKLTRKMAEMFDFAKNLT